MIVAIADRIHVTHLNLRQSIYLLLFQLLFVNTLALLIIITSYLLILNYESAINLFFKSLAGLVILIAVLIFQAFFTTYAILQWINEYYELSRHELIHRKGIIWRKVEKYSIEHIRYAEINQGLIGKLLNYGTVSLYDTRRIKFLDLYLIHSPLKYLEVFEALNPDLDEVESVIRGNEGLNYT